jgi:hypothetical protein
MDEKLINKLANINKNKFSSTSTIPSHLPKDYIKFLELYNGGNGFIGENSYIHLWSVDEIEEYNVGYMVEEFIPGIILIGSDGAEMAYGIQRDGKYIEVPFIGMDYNEVTVIASNFNDFINYLDK